MMNTNPHSPENYRRLAVEKEALKAHAAKRAHEAYMGLSPLARKLLAELRQAA